MGNPVPPTPPAQSSGWKPLCRLLGIVSEVPALFLTLMTVNAVKLAGPDDFDVMMRNNVIAGGLFALAFILFCAPRLPGGALWRYVLGAVVALLIWAAVSGGLIWKLSKLRP